MSPQNFQNIFLSNLATTIPPILSTHSNCKYSLKSLFKSTINFSQKLYLPSASPVIPLISSYNIE